MSERERESKQKVDRHNLNNAATFAIKEMLFEGIARVKHRLVHSPKAD